MLDDQATRGMQVRREVLGDAHVDASMAAATPLTQPFQDYITRAAWSDVWGREGLDRSVRSLITIALLAALGHDHELRLHLRASRRTGATFEEIVEALLHVAVYAGVPAANRAFAALNEVMAETDHPADSIQEEQA